MPYKLVIFDFDGTLADSGGRMLDVLNQVARRHRFRQVIPDEVEMLRGLGNREIMAYLGVRKWRLPWIAHDMRRLSAATSDRISLFEGVGELLAQLSAAGITTAIVTSNSETTVRRVLGPQNAARIAHYRCGVSIFGKAVKLRGLVRQLGIAKRAVLCVGDEIRDIEAARAAGLAIASVSWGYAKPEALERSRPTLVVKSIRELAEVIRS